MRETIRNRTLVEVENTNHYDILYSASQTTAEATRSFTTRIAEQVEAGR
ncbi:MAG: hypothetical protein M3305_01740 [Actinomycetota bacterium]|jgi:hypothetical protein|nr:hypothetical protein [Actinomycetota bacterium]